MNCSITKSGGDAKVELFPGARPPDTTFTSWYDLTLALVHIISPDPIMKPHIAHHRFPTCQAINTLSPSGAPAGACELLAWSLSSCHSSPTPRKKSCAGVAGRWTLKFMMLNYQTCGFCYHKCSELWNSWHSSRNTWNPFWKKMLLIYLQWFKPPEIHDRHILWSWCVRVI